MSIVSYGPSCTVPAGRVMSTGSDAVLCVGGAGADDGAERVEQADEAEEEDEDEDDDAEVEAVEPEPLFFGVPDHEPVTWRTLTQESPVRVLWCCRLWMLVLWAWPVFVAWPCPGLGLLLVVAWWVRGRVHAPWVPTI